ncbi:acyl-CoA dehydrogenase family protein [Nocardia aurea]|uniref:acyl-CoA dehydrogenase family protein n=1 Tax=Nocardia aurea TaxID=2144174 RepID=UPI000D69C4A4|nr:acyl-CoA dehydrogenase family protein [Nocardia aurea]
MTATLDSADTDYTDLIEGIAAFVKRKVVPLEEANRELLENPRLTFDEKGGYSAPVLDLMRQVREASAAAGYYAMFAPEELGGEGLGALALFCVWEGLSHLVGPGRLLPDQVIGHWTSGPSFLLGEVHPSLRDGVVQEVMSGAATVCFGMSEPDAGSDAWAMSTRAVRDGDSWVLNGTKQWTSNSAHGKYAFVWAVTDDQKRRDRTGGITLFLVPTDTPGFAVDSVLRLFEHVGGNETILSLSDVRVPDTHVVGAVDQGFALALQGVSNGRMYNAGHCVGMAKWALEEANRYTTVRTAFGNPIADYQGVSFQLADCAIEIYASKTMSVDCARRLDRGEKARKELNIVKAYTTEACFRIFDRCMQVCGGMGLTNEMRFVSGWHFARMVRIADGTGEVMRRNIANSLRKGDLGF